MKARWWFWWDTRYNRLIKTLFLKDLRTLDSYYTLSYNNIFPYTIHFRNTWKSHTLLVTFSKSWQGIFINQIWPLYCFQYLQIASSESPHFSNLISIDYCHLHFTSWSITFITVLVSPFMGYPRMLTCCFEILKAF